MEPGKFYHVYNRGDNRQDIFLADDNYLFFLQKFNEYLGAWVEVFSFCLMPNHFHLFLKMREADLLPVNALPTGLIKAFRDLFIAYSKAINKRYNRTGALFQQKFKRKEIDNDAYFSWIIQYIHMNPVKAGLCDHPSKWKYSSYNAVISEKPTRVCVKEVLEWFGGVKEFVRIHDERALEESNIKRLLG